VPSEARLCDFRDFLNDHELTAFHVDEGCVIGMNFRQKTRLIECGVHFFNTVKAPLARRTLIPPTEVLFPPGSLHAIVHIVGCVV
jgi:hypothetical protein